jgi:hypothetical protein
LIDLASVTTLLHEHKQAVGWIAAFSMLIFVGSLLAVPWLAVRIPEDYFATRDRPRTRFADRHPLLRSAVWTARNLLGILLILAGLSMLVLPGQGLLTLAVGVFLMDFPGKHRLERRIIQIRLVRKSINWFRRKANVNPLKLEPDETQAC